MADQDGLGLKMGKLRFGGVFWMGFGFGDWDRV